MDWTRIERRARWLERGLAAVGASCLIWAGTISMYAVAYQLEQGAVLEGLDPPRRPKTDARADDDRARYRATVPIGRLDIPRVGLSVVVVEGDDEKTLQVAVGHLPDTPFPWQEGNAVLAGHRDTFFRPLRRVQVGDAIHLDTAHGTFTYRVTRQMIVEPHELWVLNPSATAALTLITCYPFDFVGPAPQRFVVHAERVGDTSDVSRTTATRTDGVDAQ